MTLSAFRAIVLAGAAVLPAARASACVWDTDTIRDELQTRADVFDLISGQFPHNGRVRRFERVEAELVGAGAEVDFAAVEKEMERRGFSRMRPEERGIVRSILGFFTHPVPKWGLVIASLALLAIVVPGAMRRRIQRNRGGQVPGSL